MADVAEREVGEDISPVNAAIQRAKQQLQHMIDLNPASMLLLESDGCVARANRSALTLLGFEFFKDVLGKRVSVLVEGVEPAFFDEFLDGASTLRTGETTANLPGRGERVLRFDRVSSGDAGEGCVLLVRDVTQVREQAKAEEKIHKRAAVDALKGALMHHLNQPLTVLTVRCRLLMTALEDGKADAKDACATLQDIMDLAMQTAEIMARVKASEDYVTEEYTEGVDILKIGDGDAN